MGLSDTYIPLVYISQQSGWVYVGGVETSAVLFLFRAAIGTLADYLMVCFQRKESCYNLGKCFYNLKSVDVDIYVYTHVLYVFICIYIHISMYVYVLETIELLKLPPSFFKTKIVFSNI